MFFPRHLPHPHSFDLSTFPHPIPRKKSLQIHLTRTFSWSSSLQWWKHEQFVLSIWTMKSMKFQSINRPLWEPRSSQWISLLVGMWKKVHQMVVFNQVPTTGPTTVTLCGRESWELMNPICYIIYIYIGYTYITVMCRHIYLYRDKFLYMPSSYAEWSCYMLWVDIYRKESQTWHCQRFVCFCYFCLDTSQHTNNQFESLYCQFDRWSFIHWYLNFWDLSYVHVMNGHIHTTTVATYQTSNHSRAGGRHLTALINKGHLWITANFEAQHKLQSIWKVIWKPIFVQVFRSWTPISNTISLSSHVPWLRMLKKPPPQRNGACSSLCSSPMASHGFCPSWHQRLWNVWRRAFPKSHSPGLIGWLQMPRKAFK